MKTRDLPQWAKTIITVDSIPTKVTFKKMDWMYGQWFTDDWEMFVFNADFEKDWDFYKIIDKD